MTDKIQKVEEAIKEEQDEEIVKETEDVEVMDTVSCWSKVGVKMFLIYFSIIVILTLITAKVMFFPASSPLDIFADADTDVESDSEGTPSSSGSVERIFVPLNRNYTGAIHSVNSNGTDYKFLDFGAYKTINHISVVKNLTDYVGVSYTKGSDYNRSYIYKWTENLITTKPVVEANTIELEFDNDGRKFAYVEKSAKGKQSITLCGSDKSISARIESDKSNYFSPRFDVLGEILYYIEHSEDNKEKYNIRAFGPTSLHEIVAVIKVRPDQMFVSPSSDILIRVKNESGNNELVLINSKTAAAKSLYQSKKEFICAGFSANGQEIYFIKRSGYSGWAFFKLILKADGKNVVQLIKDENGYMIKI